MAKVNIYKILLFLLFISCAYADEDINIKNVTYEETKDCKYKSTWEEVYDKEGKLIGYIVIQSSLCSNN